MKYFIFIFLAIFFIGCSASRISVNENFWNEKKESKIGIVITKIPEPQTYKGGSQGLIDMVINNAIAADLDDHLKTINVSEFKEIKYGFSEQLHSKGYNSVVLINEDIDLDSLKYFREKTDKKACKKDFRKYKELYNLDFLIVFSIDRYGTIRNYYGFIPLGAPQGLFQVNGMMINLSTNEYEWYVEMEEKESIKDVMGEWDEEPDFPNLTKAIIAAMNSAKEFMVYNFFNSKGQS